MVNPYTPGTKEYALLSNLIELVDHIEDYVSHCKPLGNEINCDAIRDMINHHSEEHRNILKE